MPSVCEQKKACFLAPLLRMVTLPTDLDSYVDLPTEIN